MRHLFIAGGCLLLGMSIACNPIKELDPDTPAITSGDVIAHFTSANESKLFQTDYIDYSDDLGNFTIQLKPDQTYQEIDGFGAALTGSAACLLTNEMDASSRTALLKELFDPINGIGISYLRLTIGSSDFSMGDYTYCDEKGIENFAIPEIDRNELLPIVKEIVSINPNIKLMATPWSAPAWMKTNNSMKGGSLKDEYMADYAEYFVKYIRAFEAEGIRFDAITTQNEPDHETTGMPSMKMSWQQQSTFIREHLGPRFRAENITTKILLLDHNWDLWEYPVNILNDRQTAQYVAGTAFHGYGGSVNQMANVREAHPDKELFFTEQSGGGWGGGFSGDLIWFSRDIFIGTMNQNCRNALLWNLALDDLNGPQNGGCTNCRGVVTVNGNQVMRNVEYYVLAQFAKYTQPGAKRIGYNIAGTQPTKFYISAVTNPDGSCVVFVLNDTEAVQNFSIRFGEKRITYQISAATVGTFVLK